jgi:hypothetical protein
MGVYHAPREAGYLSEVLPVDYVSYAANRHRHQQCRCRHIGEVAYSGEVCPLWLAEQGRKGPPYGQEPVGVADQQVKRPAYKTAGYCPENGNAPLPYLKHPDEVVLVDFVPKIDDVQDPRAYHPSDDCPHCGRIEHVGHHTLTGSPPDDQVNSGRNGDESEHPMPRKDKAASVDQVGTYTN